MTTLFYINHECLVWETEKSNMGQCQTSPVFNISASKLQFELHCKQYVASSNVYYSLILKKSHIPSPDTSIFSLRTWFRDEDENLYESYYHLKEVGQNRALQLWIISERSLSQMIPKFGKDGVVRVVFAFYSFSGRSLTVGIDVGQHKFPVTKSSFQLENVNSTILKSTCNLKSLSQDINKLLYRDLLSDVQLKCGDHTFPAHKAILAARSDVFSAMFQCEMKESESGLINIEDIDASVMEVFLKYLYSGSIPDTLTGDMLLKLFSAGDKYLVYPLLKNCFSFMAKNLTVQNCLDFLTVVEIHGHAELKSVIIDFIAKNGQVMRNDAWKSIELQHPELAKEITDKHKLVIKANILMLKTLRQRRTYI